MDKKEVYRVMDEAADVIWGLSDAIWEVPETAFRETKSAALQCEALKKLGFEVTENLAGIPTAFSGRWGSGKPVIGILGEFDALAGLSQKACSAVKEPLIAGGNGHGCGHNLLGAGSMAAAYGIKQYLESTGKEGTVIYFGCPGEEGGSGKAFMARDGVFAELDFALTWHPMDYTCAWYESSLANYQVNYKFKGISSHAAAAPHLGRSALDAVELMNIGVQFLREHVIPEVRMHYAITNTGGFSPNVVQSEAEVLYLIRAPKTPIVQETYERVNDIARGAALMTGTQVEISFIKACSNFVVNDTLTDWVQANMEETSLPQLTGDELKFAAAIQDSLEKKSDPLAPMLRLMTNEEAKKVREKVTGPVLNFVIPRIHANSVLPGSTDVGDVSWVCPTAQMTAAAWAAGTPAHSWQAVSQGKGSIAHKELLYAGKVLAGTAIDMIEHPEQIAKAKEELAERLDHKPFVSPIPKEVKPKAIGM
ncbi:MAG: amidohydrolase [Roseburia sp.]|nr:amidohydrolase [Roseburia sp.]